MRHPARPRSVPRPPRGFTLIELLVVAGLAAVAFALFAGALVGALPGQQLRDASSALAAELRATRARALASGRDQQFLLDTRSREWRSLEAGRETPRRQGRLPEALQLGATVAREEQPGPGIAAIRFFADGSSTGGRIVLRREGAAWHVDVHWLTGAVRVERGEGGR
jgi:general secretion pathway protein H